MPTEIAGYATVYHNVTSSVYTKAAGIHHATFAPGAFDRVLREQTEPVIATIGHDDELLVATTANGTLCLSADDYGLFVRVIPCGKVGAMLRDALAEGRLQQMSIAWLPGETKVIGARNGVSIIQTVTVSRLVDVTFTNDGAMPGTVASLIDSLKA